MSSPEEIREIDEALSDLIVGRDALNREIRALKKRRRRLTGEPEQSSPPEAKVTDDDILAAIPEQGIRVRALERLVCERFGCVRATFYRHWQELGDSNQVRKVGPLVFRA